eukprot:gnl/Hemi2/18678_TR6188_c0_g1_i1.p2 gnl/Hemi2/18678_TR6188_c0_g1~~gnl/Hemi2/18678_TR6188_c0_g1_i1.p2  ORF type:complete len:116 (+),score=26.06 gnl/Hemi2/18678_TR6188_c0_g1_i1:104-451(+)
MSENTCKARICAEESAATTTSTTAVVSSLKTNEKERDPTAPYTSAELRYLSQCDENLVCSVCLSPVLDPHVCKNCDQVFCALHIPSLPACPLCRFPWAPDNIPLPASRLIFSIVS